MRPASAGSCDSSIVSRLLSPGDTNDVTADSTIWPLSSSIAAVVAVSSATAPSTAVSAAVTAARAAASCSWWLLTSMVRRNSSSWSSSSDALSASRSAVRAARSTRVRSRAARGSPSAALAVATGDSARALTRTHGTRRDGVAHRRIIRSVPWSLGRRRTTCGSSGQGLAVTQRQCVAEP